MSSMPLIQGSEEDLVACYLRGSMRMGPMIAIRIRNIYRINEP